LKQRVSVKRITIKPVLVVGALVCVAAPAFGLGILSEPQAATASMVWLGLVGLAVAGTPRRRDERSEPPVDRPAPGSR
jgi:hypothetical protein